MGDEKKRRTEDLLKPLEQSTDVSMMPADLELAVQISDYDIRQQSTRPIGCVYSALLLIMAQSRMQLLVLGRPSLETYTFFKLG